MNDSGTARPSAAVVLSGGGVAGIAWTVGVLDALSARAVDLSRAEVIGTSAGSVAGVALAAGRIGEAVAMQRGPSREIPVELDLLGYISEIEQIRRSASDAANAARQMARYRYAAPPATPEQWLQSLAARLPVSNWPAQPLLVAAVDADTGERTVFSAGSGVGLLEAVAASCALPGIWPPVQIEGRCYMDGGIHSNTNADLALDSERVLVLVAVPPNPYFEQTLQAELGQLRDTRTLVVRMDEQAAAAIGANTLHPAGRGPGLEAGRRQGAQVAEGVRTLLG